MQVLSTGFDKAEKRWQHGKAARDRLVRRQRPQPSSRKPAAATGRRCAGRCGACRRSTTRHWPPADCALRNGRSWSALRGRGGRLWVNSPHLSSSIVRHWPTTSNRPSGRAGGGGGGGGGEGEPGGCAGRGRPGETRPVAAALGRSPTPVRARIRRGKGESVASNVGLHCLAGVRPHPR